MHKIIFIFFLVLIRIQLTGQSVCPANIGFELGSFQNWECSMGSISAVNGDISLVPSQPFSGRHSMIPNSFPQTLDMYGGFPVNCPNGSGFSIQLGNSGTGRQAEQASYTFTIPTDQNNYSIIYNYAVVFQDPSHATWQQPKFTANVFDVSNGAYIGCSSFSYAASSNLPGFKESTVKDSVFYKSWTPVTIKLSGYAGKTIRLEFTTNDCSRGGHFGYAYVDVNENCSSPISGNVYCVNVQSQTLVAPFGFSGYRWFTSDFSRILGNEITLSFSPVPPPNTVFAVEITPYPDQGCIDTVYTTIISSPEIIDLKIPFGSVQSCITTGLDITAGRITAGSSPGLSFSYFTDPGQTNYVPTPKFITASGTYYIKATNSVGCTFMRPIVVQISTYPVFSIQPPKPVTRPDYIDLTTISDNSSGIDFTFWQDSLATISITKPESMSKSGTYYIKATNSGGCFLIKPVTIQVNEPLVIPANAFSPNGDGIHDQWEIPLISLYPDCVVEIFNRSGQLLFRSVGYNSPWNGKFKGIELPVATYYYIIKPSAELAALSGSVTIIR